MSYESPKFQDIDSARRAGDKCDAQSPSKATGRTREPGRNWAWAHSNESYDWMDSHSPFSASDSNR